MKPKILFGLFAVGFFYALTQNIHGATLGEVFISSIFQATLYFGILASAAYSLKAFREGNAKTGLVVLGQTAFIGLLAVVLLVLFMPLCMTAITPAHLRTNTLTGQCEFGGFSSCVARDPWYYNKGCQVRKAEIISTVKESEYFHNVEETCNRYCQKNTQTNQTEKCRTDLREYRLAQAGVTCQDLLPS